MKIPLSILFVGIIAIKSIAYTYQYVSQNEMKSSLSVSANIKISHAYTQTIKIIHKYEEPSKRNETKKKNEVQNAEF